MNWISGQKHILACVQGIGKVIEPAGIKKAFQMSAYPFTIQSQPSSKSGWITSQILIWQTKHWSDSVCPLQIC